MYLQRTQILVSLLERSTYVGDSKISPCSSSALPGADSHIRAEALTRKEVGTWFLTRSYRLRLSFNTSSDTMCSFLATSSSIFHVQLMYLSASLLLLELAIKSHYCMGAPFVKNSPRSPLSRQPDNCICRQLWLILQRLLHIIRQARCQICLHIAGMDSVCQQALS